MRPRQICPPFLPLVSTMTTYIRTTLLKLQTPTFSSPINLAPTASTPYDSSKDPKSSPSSNPENILSTCLPGKVMPQKLRLAMKEPQEKTRMESVSRYVVPHISGLQVRSYSQYQELALPKTIVMRLAKGVLPANTQVQKDAILAMSKSATVFVNYLASQYVLRHNFHFHESSHIFNWSR